MTAILAEADAGGSHDMLARLVAPVLASFLAAAGFLTVVAQPTLAAEPGCKPDMAIAPATVKRASLAANEARLTFVGHSTFLIESARGVSAATDYNDYVRPALPPNIATMNKAHSTHFTNTPDPSILHVLPGWNTRGVGPAQHDVTVQDMRVRNVSTNIRSWAGATDFDGNSIFVFEIGDMCVVHLGHLHHTLEPGHLRAIGRADIVLAPVDGGATLDMDGMIDVLKTLQPRVIIPMHYFSRTSLERFLFKASNDWTIDQRETPVFVTSREALPKQTTVIVLPGR
jgi:L-ascorbate metabolism protein UlaG (beta-lactamase superfamily)